MVDLSTDTLIATIAAPDDPFAIAIQPPVTTLSVDVDIKPGSSQNSVAVRNKGVIPVAILGTDSFDATDVDPSTLAFGPGGAPIAHGNGHIEDVDDDGILDLMAHFRTKETGITCGDVGATLTGETFGGLAIEGSDSVRTTGCS